MLYGPSAGDTRNAGATSLKYPSRYVGSVLALSVSISGAWKPRCDRIAEPTAACQSFSLMIVNPCPGPTMFQPIIPTGSHILEKATAVVGGVLGCGVLYATLSSSVIRDTLPYWLSCLNTSEF